MPLLSTFHNVDMNIVLALSRLSNPVLTAESLIERDHLQLARELTIPIRQLDEFRISLLRELSPPSFQPTNVLPNTTSNHFNSAFQMRTVYHEVNMTIGCCSKRLNDLLGGGIQMNEITELVGLSGVGKVI